MFYFIHTYIKKISNWQKKRKKRNKSSQVTTSSEKKKLEQNEEIEREKKNFSEMFPLTDNWTLMFTLLTWIVKSASFGIISAPDALQLALASDIELFFQLQLTRQECVHFKWL